MVAPPFRGKEGCVGHTLAWMTFVPGYSLFLKGSPKTEKITRSAIIGANFFEDVRETRDN